MRVLSSLDFMLAEYKTLTGTINQKAIKKSAFWQNYALG
jgi:hypothetical protein